MNVRARAFDDGVGFRYEVPEQRGLNYATLRGEDTQFALPADMTMYVIPGDYDSDEFLYTVAPVSQLKEKMPNPRHTESSRIPGLAAQTPLLMKHPERPLYVNIHEAALVGYPAMAVEIDADAKVLKSHLTPDKTACALSSSPVCHTLAYNHDRRRSHRHPRFPTYLQPQRAQRD